LKFRAVKADSGAIGGDGSQEFHVLADSGEDGLAYCESSDYAANVELAEAVVSGERAAATETMQQVDTPKQTACEDVAALLAIDVSRTVKSIALMLKDEAGEEQFCLALIRGDHHLNEVKLTKVEGCSDFRFATEEEIRAHLNNCPPGFIGPVGVASDIKVIADKTVALMGDFVCGANQPKLHLQGVNFGRDLPEPSAVADIRNVIEGDASPDGKGTLSLCRGVEVGHIFQLGNKYSQAMEATYLDENGKTQVMEMGCYGIGVSRIVGAAIEQGYDQNGIIFPESMAPFTVVICPIGFHKSELVAEKALDIYQSLQAKGVDVLLDDRGERPGVMFAEADLMGVPHRIVIGDRGLKAQEVEYKARQVEEPEMIALDDIVQHISGLLNKR